MPVSEQIW